MDSITTITHNEAHKIFTAIHPLTKVSLIKVRTQRLAQLAELPTVILLDVWANNGLHLHIFTDSWSTF